MMCKKTLRHVIVIDGNIAMNVHDSQSTKSASSHGCPKPYPQSSHSRENFAHSRKTSQLKCMQFEATCLNIFGKRVSSQIFTAAARVSGRSVGGF